jgi:hypothetical protein
MHLFIICSQETGKPQKKRSKNEKLDEEPWSEANLYKSVEGLSGKRRHPVDKYLLPFPE